MNKILVTGATGLIGQGLVKRLIDNGNYVIAMVRNKEKAIEILGNESINLKYVVGDVTTFNPEKLDIDYIIHGASQTSSKAFVNEPVETIMTALNGTKNMLEIARLSNVKSFVYLSSMEVYGSPTTDEKIKETHSTNIDSMIVRSCYPESKRMCESLCTSYLSEYNVPTKVVRLTQTFGPGVQYNDERVFAEFARCAIEGKNIVLKTKGLTKRNYLFTDDAVNAILTVLYKGVPGEAYNAANESTYCSIFEMANFVADQFGNGKVKVLIEENRVEKNGYAPTLHMNLDTSKLRNLGWISQVDLYDMFSLMIEDMKKIYIRSFQNYNNNFSNIETLDLQDVGNDIKTTQKKL